MATREETIAKYSGVTAGLRRKTAPSHVLTTLPEPAPAAPAEPEGGLLEQAGYIARGIGGGIAKTPEVFEAAAQGQDVSILDPEQAAALRQRQAESEAFRAEGERLFGPDSFVAEATSGLRESLGYSLATMAPAIAGAVAAPATGGASLVAGAGAGSALAYRATTRDTMLNILDAANQKSVAEKGRELSPEEETALKTQFEDRVALVGAEEAGIEFLSNLVGAKLLTGAGKAAMGAARGLRTTVPGAVRAAGAVAGDIGVELAGETATEVAQTTTLAGTPGGPERGSTIAEAFEAVAPTTIATAGLIGGTVAGGSYAGQKISDMAQAKKLGVDREDLRNRLQVLMEHKTANPDFNLKSQEAQEFLKGALILDDGQFLSKAEREAQVAAAAGAAMTAGETPLQPQAAEPMLPAVVPQPAPVDRVAPVTELPTGEPIAVEPTVIPEERQLEYFDPAVFVAGEEGVATRTGVEAAAPLTRPAAVRGRFDFTRLETALPEIEGLSAKDISRAKGRLTRTVQREAKLAADPKSESKFSVTALSWRDMFSNLEDTDLADLRREAAQELGKAGSYRGQMIAAAKLSAAQDVIDSRREAAAQAVREQAPTQAALPAPEAREFIKGEAGEPLKLFHGGGAIEGSLRVENGGIFLTPDADYAKGYTVGKQGAQVIEVTARANNLAEIDEDTWDGVLQGEYQEEFLNDLKAQGFDGARIDSLTGEEIVVFSPDQVVMPGSDPASFKREEAQRATQEGQVGEGVQGERGGIGQWVPQVGQDRNVAPGVGRGSTQASRGDRYGSTPQAEVTITEQVARASVSRMRSAISRDLGRGVLANAYTVAPMPKEARGWADAVSQITGKNIVFFRNGSTAPIKLEGGTFPSMPDTLFISADAKAPHLMVTGHEFFHRFRAESPDLYPQFLDVVQSVVPKAQADAYVKKMAQWAKEEGRTLSDEEIRAQAMEELAADVFGEQFASKEFWHKLRRKTGDQFDQIVQAFIDFLDSIKAAFTGQQARDLKKARDAAVSALTAYNKRNAVGGLTPSAQFRRVDTVSRESINRIAGEITAALNRDTAKVATLPYLLKVTPLQVVVDLVKERMPKAAEFSKLIREENQIANEIIDDGQTKLNKAVELAKKGPGLDALHDVMSIGSFLQVQPWETDITKQDWVKAADGNVWKAEEMWKQAGMLDSTGLTLRQAVERGKEAYRALQSNDLKVAYQDLAKNLTDLRTREKDSLRRLIERLTEENPEARREMLDTLERSFANLKGAYMPLARFGKYIVDFTNERGQKESHRFESVAAQKEFAARVEATGTGTGVTLGVQQESQRQTANIPAGFMDQIRLQLETDLLEGIPEDDAEALAAARAQIEDVSNNLTQIFLRWTPETGTLKSNMQRRNIAGFSENMTRGYSQYVNSHGRNIAYFERGRSIQQLLQEERQRLRDERADAAETGETIDQNIDGVILNDLEARAAAARSNAVHPIASALGKLSTVWYLSSPSIALVQASQLAVMTYPRLAVKYGPGRAARLLTQGLYDSLLPRYGRDSLFFSTDPEAVEVRSVHKMMHDVVTSDNQGDAQAQGKLLGENLFSHEEVRAAISRLQRSPNGKEKMRKLALLEAIKRGVVDISMTHEALEFAKGRDTNSAAGKVQRAMLFALKQSELASRKAAVLATFDSAMEKGHTFGQAMRDVVKTVDDTLYDYSPTAKGVWMQKDLPRLLFLFQHFRIMTTARLAMLVRDIVKNETPEVRSAAAKELVGIVGVSGMLAGAFGVPGAELVFSVISSIMSDEDEPFDAKIEFDNWLSDNFSETGASLGRGGVPSALGVSLNRRIGLGSVGWTELEAPEYLHGQGLAAWYAMQALGPAYSIPAGWVKAYDYGVNKGDYIRALENATPKVAKDFFRAARIGTEGVKTGGGQRLLKQEDLTADAVLLLALGFNPEEIAYVSERKFRRGQIGERITQRRGQLVGDLVRAIENGESGVEERAAIVAFNKKMPRFAITGQDITPAFIKMKKGDLMIEGRREMMLQMQYGTTEEKARLGLK